MSRLARGPLSPLPGGIDPSNRRLAVIVPTYNEASNVEELIDGLRRELDGLDFRIVVVDDNSPDGTYYAVKMIAERDSRVTAVLRPGKMGLASAVMDGCRATDAELVVMMDSDLSHRPEDLPRLLAEIGGADVVIGSRYVPGGSVVGMSPYRYLASRVSIWISKTMLGLRQMDTTSGFAVFRREVLDAVPPDLGATGFKLLLVALAANPGARVKEVPITFVNRRRGKSKFGATEVVKYLRLCWTLRRRARAGDG